MYVINTNVLCEAVDECAMRLEEATDLLQKGNAVGAVCAIESTTFALQQLQGIINQAITIEMTGVPGEEPKDNVTNLDDYRAQRELEAPGGEEGE